MLSLSEALRSRASGWRERTEGLAAVAAALSVRGWLPATAGNFSTRVGARQVAITVSGRDKRRLGADDFVTVGLDGEVIEGSGRPSAETELHLQLYRHDPAVGAVLHTHSPNQTIAGRLLARDGVIRLQNYELLKALPGVATHATAIELPVVSNSQDMDEIAGIVGRWLEHGLGPPGYLIQDHGIYAWGADAGAALRHLETLDFLLGCEIELHRHRQ
ncbi:MAG TPA: methylthioribulose 1-phosphate dehydratase [Burkholderiaceae bacterium]|nr:methylthioribulose 1-phosphate dehydratase [Burkholderiaceae bacterium]